MKNLSIISTGSIKEVHGGNFVLNYLLAGSVFFEKIRLRAVYSSSEELIVKPGSQLPIGEGFDTFSYKQMRMVRSLLRVMFSSKYALGAYLKEYLNFKVKARKVASKVREKCVNDEILLFQDIYAAYYYFKKVNFENVRTAMIIHQEDDSMSQLLMGFPYFAHPNRQNHFLHLRDFVYSRLDAVIYISEKAYANSIVEKEKRRMIYNGIPNIDSSLLSSRNGRDVFNLICVGSMSGRKGQDLAIRALSLLPESTLKKVRLYLVGDGPERTKLEILSKSLRLSDKVVFTGVRHDVDIILKDMDIFIMPSLSEGLSISSLEALRAGLYLMMTDTGGNCEVMEGGCGMVIERDPQDISIKLGKIIENGVISNLQKQNGASRFNKLFSLETMSRKYDRVLSEL